MPSASTALRMHQKAASAKHFHHQSWRWRLLMIDPLALLLGGQWARPLAQNSIRITTRLGVGLLTSAKPAAAKMLRLPTWSSPQVISFPGSVSIG
jgi:hypothetical protein